MITVKTAPYSEKEIRALSYVMHSAKTTFTATFCKPETPCNECLYRHLCYDLSKASQYAEKKLDEIYLKGGEE